MLRPFHVRGAGRFLILSQGGVVEADLVRKNAVLVRWARKGPSLRSSG
jgi:hypothetical protein